MRKSPIAGAWYPGNPEKLKSLVNKLLSKADTPELKGKPLGVIAPHAGIQFSGGAAAYAYNALKQADFKRFIIIGPSHRTYFKGLAVSGEDAYETPLGCVPVDQEACRELSAHPLFDGPETAELAEHSLEMQLPFLQVLFDEFSIIPLVAGELSKDDYVRAAERLKPYLDETTAVVISSDFTHYGHSFGYTPFVTDVRENLEKLDGDAIKKIVSKDLDGFLDYVAKTGATICGLRPIGLFLKLLPDRAEGQLLSYTTSGEIMNDYTDSVSYAAIVFTA